MTNIGNFVARATMNANGQVTLSPAVLEQLGCKEGQTLVFTSLNGRIILANEGGKDNDNDEEDAVFVPTYEDLVSYDKCLDQCTLC